MSTEIKNTGEMVERALHNLRTKTEEGLKDVVRQEEVEKIKSYLDGKIDALQEAVAAQNSIKSIEDADDGEARMKAAIGEYFLKGNDAFSGPIRDGRVEIKADGGTAAVTVAVQGGVTLPKVFDSLVDPIIRKHSPIRDMAKVVRGNQGFVTPIVTSKGVAGQRTEFGALTTSNAPKYDLLTHAFVEINGTEALTVWADLNDNSIVDYTQSVINDTAAALAENESAYFMTGTTLNTLQQAGGTFNNGLLQQTMLADGTVDKYTSTFGSLAGVMSATKNALVPDDVISLIYSLHEKYEPTAQLLLSRDASRVLYTTKDGQGRYLLTVGNPQEGFKPAILGVPFRTGDFMPTVAAAGTTPVAIIADFKQAVEIVDASDVRWLVDPYTDKRLIQYTGRRLTSSAIVNYNAIRALYVKQS